MAIEILDFPSKTGDFSIVMWLFTGGYNNIGATLTLLRAGIAEGLRIFEMPCRWIFNVDVYVIHDHDIMIMMMIMTIIIITIIITTIIIIVVVVVIIIIIPVIIIIIIIPYEDMLMLFLIQRSCQKGWRMLTSYEDKFMWLYTPFNIFARGGGGCLIPYEYKTYTLMVLPHSTWLDTGDDDGDDDDDDDDDDEEEDDDDCKCGATSRLDGRNIL